MTVTTSLAKTAERLTQRGLYKEAFVLDNVLYRYSQKTGLADFAFFFTNWFLYHFSPLKRKSIFSEEVRKTLPKFVGILNGLIEGTEAVQRETPAEREKANALKGIFENVLKDVIKLNNMSQSAVITKDKVKGKLQNFIRDFLSYFEPYKHPEVEVPKPEIWSEIKGKVERVISELIGAISTASANVGAIAKESINKVESLLKETPEFREAYLKNQQQKFQKTYLTRKKLADPRRDTKYFLPVVEEELHDEGKTVGEKIKTYEGEKGSVPFVYIKDEKMSKGRGQEITYIREQINKLEKRKKEVLSEKEKFKAEWEGVAGKHTEPVYLRGINKILDEIDAIDTMISEYNAKLHFIYELAGQRSEERITGTSWNKFLENVFKPLNKIVERIGSLDIHPEKIFDSVEEKYNKVRKFLA